MIDTGFNFVTVGSEQRFMTNGSKNVLDVLKNIKTSNKIKGY